MRGANNQMNRPGMPGTNMAPGVGRMQSPNLAAVLLQQQQQMLLQHQQQQFLARQQIIQQEQLQKQRLLRQQEEQALQMLRDQPQLNHHHHQQQMPQQQKHPNQQHMQHQLLLQQHQLEMKLQQRQQNQHQPLNFPQRHSNPIQQNLMQESKLINSGGSGLSQGSSGHVMDMSRPPTSTSFGASAQPICGLTVTHRSGQSQQSNQGSRLQFKSPCQASLDTAKRKFDFSSGSQVSASRRDASSRSGSSQSRRPDSWTNFSALSRSSTSLRDSDKRSVTDRRQEDYVRRNTRDFVRPRGGDSTKRQDRDSERPDSQELDRDGDPLSRSREEHSHSFSSSRLQLPAKRERAEQFGRDSSRSISQGRLSSRSDSARGSVDDERECLRSSGQSSRSHSRSRDSSSSSRTTASDYSSLSRTIDRSPSQRPEDPKLFSPRKSGSNCNEERGRSLSRSRKSPLKSRTMSRRSMSYTRSPARDHSRSREHDKLNLSKHDSLSNKELSPEPVDLKPSSSSSGSALPDPPRVGAEVKDEGREIERITTFFTRSCPAEIFFTRNSDNNNMEATPRMVELEKEFEEEMNKRLQVKEDFELEESLQANHHHHHHHHYYGKCCRGGSKRSSKRYRSSSSSSSASSSEDDDDDDDDGGVNQIMEEWDRRKKHPQSLHPELWFNLKGQANDGPLCRCSVKSRQSGIRHDIYPGEKAIPLCDLETNNLDRLYHYRMTMSPYTNFLTKVPTLIQYDDHEFIFEGFSVFSHVPLENIPPCKLLRFNIEYTISFEPETAPENFTVRSLDLFNKFIFTEILELVNLDWTGPKDAETGQEGCKCFHFMPRFCRTLPESGCKEVLSMNTVLSFLLQSLSPLVEEQRVEEIMKCDEAEWHAKVDHLRGMIVTKPGMRPSAIRIDQLDRKVTTPVVKVKCFNDSDDDSQEDAGKRDRKKSEGKKEKTSVGDGMRETDRKGPTFPLIIHQGNRPAQLSYAGDPVYRKTWKQYVKFRHLLNSKPKVLPADKAKLKEQEERLREYRMKKTMKREVTVELSSQGFLTTGLRADLCQHALMVPVLISHLRFHICLRVLEDTLQYSFKDRNLLQLCLTHTSYRTNYGTNPDHTRNSLTNCGMRQVDYGDRRIHYQNTRKRGICILVDIMSRMGKQEETASEIPHNERLEFLGDAVIEFLTSVHLFYMFPWLDEGGLTTYRMALVQNQHLAVVAKKLKLQDFMLYVHGPDLCHESDLRHAMANCCEAIIGALFLDGGIEVADSIFSRALFDDEKILLKTWTDIPKHVLQHEEPGGDRHWIKSSPVLQKLETFEESVGIKFTHIRLLAKAFTHRNIGVNPLTRGHNQRLEFLGDTVLQLVASEYLYWHYPEHHEGHLSLLRSSLVNSRTQSMVYDDLGMSKYVIINDHSSPEGGLEMKTKQRADILESFVGALFVDKDLDYCRTFCNVCFFPRLKDFIINQDWNDPKSQLQQCCLTLREVGGGEPDIPVYKVIESIGPTNTRKYVVAVYFRGKRLARGSGHNIQQAQMAAATQALKRRAELFPILKHQRRFLDRMQKVEAVREHSAKAYDSDAINHDRERGERGSKRPRMSSPIFIGAREEKGVKTREEIWRPRYTFSRQSRQGGKGGERCRDSSGD